VDEDGDGVLDDDDLCPGTVIAEGVPTNHLGVNRWALTDDDLMFDTNMPPGGGPGYQFDTADTGGCSCEQIIVARGLGEGHRYFGCSNGVMLGWVNWVAGAGYDARLIQATNPVLKKRIGFVAYVAAGIRQLFELKPIKVDVETDDERLFMRAHTVMIINIGNIDNLGLAMGPNITPHDSKLNVMVLSNKTFFGTLRVFLKILTKRYYGYAKLKHFQARRIRVTASPRLPVQIDGESLGQTPFLAEVIPDALSVLVPTDYGLEERRVATPRFLRRIFSPIER